MLSIYRTYVASERDQIEDEDRGEIARAVAEARENRPDLDSGLFDFIYDCTGLALSRGGLRRSFCFAFNNSLPR